MLIYVVFKLWSITSLWVKGRLVALYNNVLYRGTNYPTCFVSEVKSEQV